MNVMELYLFKIRVSSYYANDVHITNHSFLITVRLEMFGFIGRLIAIELVGGAQLLVLQCNDSSFQVLDLLQQGDQHPTLCRYRVEFLRHSVFSVSLPI